MKRTAEQIMQDLEKKYAELAECRRHLRCWIAAMNCGYRQDEIAAFVLNPEEKKGIPKGACVGFKLKDGRKLGFDGKPLPVRYGEFGNPNFSDERPIL